jgi:hypothetical protein
MLMHPMGHRLGGGAAVLLDAEYAWFDFMFPLRYHR